MISIRHLLVLTLVLNTAAMFRASTAAGQTVNPVPAPTIINSAPYTISIPGYYQLGANLDSTATSGNIITINASNVTLDFAGHYISGPTGVVTTSTVFGVYAYEHGNITIQNGTVANCYQGIELTGTGSSTSNAYNEVVQNMLVTYCGHVGINFYGSLYSTATNNKVSNTGGATASNGTGTYAMFMVATDCVVSDNIITNVNAPSGNNGGTYGIYIQDGATGIVTRNRIFASSVGISLGSTASKYQDNLTSGCTTPFQGGTDGGGNS